MKTVKQIAIDINAIGSSEKVIKVRVPATVLDLFALYASGNTDPGLANRLLTKLSRANAALVLEVFRYHLPFIYDESTGTFGKMYQGKRRDQRIQRMADYVENSVNVWEFVKARKGKDENKPKTSRVERVQKTIKTALFAKKDAITVEQLAQALTDAGVNPSELIAHLKQVERSAEAA